MTDMPCQNPTNKSWNYELQDPHPQSIPIYLCANIVATLSGGRDALREVAR